MANTIEICGDDPIYIDPSMEQCESCEQFIKDLEALQDEVDKKQDKLTAGDNVTINGNTISAKDTTYTAGDNVTIENGVISAVGGGTEYTAGENITIENGVISAENTTYSNASTVVQEQSGADGYVSLGLFPSDGAPITLAKIVAGDGITLEAGSNQEGTLNIDTDVVATKDDLADYVAKSELTKAKLLEILGAEEVTFSKTDGSGTVSGYFLGKVE